MRCVTCLLAIERVLPFGFISAISQATFARCPGLDSAEDSTIETSELEGAKRFCRTGVGIYRECSIPVTNAPYDRNTRFLSPSHVSVQHTGLNLFQSVLRREWLAEIRRKFNTYGEDQYENGGLFTHWQGE